MTNSELFLYALTLAVRALSLDLGMRLTGIRDPSNFRKFIKPLIARGLVRTCRTFALPIPEMKEPLLSSEIFGVGRHEGETPSTEVLNQVLRRARARWAGLTASPVTCWVATRAAGKIYGVKRTGTLPNHLQISHDLCVSNLFVQMITKGLIQAEQWQGEDFGGCRCGDKFADAVLLAGGGKPSTVLEVVGAEYSLDKLVSITRHSRGSYELW